MLGRAGRTGRRLGVEGARSADRCARSARSRCRRGSCPRRRSQPASGAHARAGVTLGREIIVVDVPRRLGCSRSCRTRTGRQVPPSRREASARRREVGERAGDPHVDQAVLEPGRAVPIGRKLPSPSGSPTPWPGNAASPSSVSTGALIVEPDDEEVVLQLRAAGHAVACVDGHLDPRHARVTESTSIAQHVRSRLLPAARERGRAPIGVVEEDRVAQISAALPDRRVDDRPLGGRVRASRRCSSSMHLTMRTSSPDQATYGMFVVHRVAGLETGVNRPALPMPCSTSPGQRAPRAKRVPAPASVLFAYRCFPHS